MDDPTLPAAGAAADEAATSAAVVAAGAGGGGPAGAAAVVHRSGGGLQARPGSKQQQARPFLTGRVLPDVVATVLRRIIRAFTPDRKKTPSTEEYDGNALQELERVMAQHAGTHPAAAGGVGIGGSSMSAEEVGETAAAAAAVAAPMASSTCHRCSACGKVGCDVELICANCMTVRYDGTSDLRQFLLMLRVDAARGQFICQLEAVCLRKSARLARTRWLSSALWHPTSVSDTSYIRRRSAALTEPCVCIALAVRPCDLIKRQRASRHSLSHINIIVWFAGTAATSARSGTSASTGSCAMRAAGGSCQTWLWRLRCCCLAPCKRNGRSCRTGLQRSASAGAWPQKILSGGGHQQ